MPIRSSGLDIRAGGQQQFYVGHSATAGSDQQRRGAGAVLLFQVGAVSQKDGDDIPMIDHIARFLSVLDSQMQRRGALMGQGIHLGMICKKRLSGPGPSMLGGMMECGPAIGVLNAHIGAIGDQQLNHIPVATIGRNV